MPQRCRSATPGRATATVGRCRAGADAASGHPVHRPERLNRRRSALRPPGASARSAVSTSRPAPRTAHSPTGRAFWAAPPTLSRVTGASRAVEDLPGDAQRRRGRRCEPPSRRPPAALPPPAWIARMSPSLACHWRARALHISVAPRSPRARLPKCESDATSAVCACAGVSSKGGGAWWLCDHGRAGLVGAARGGAAGRGRRVACVAGIVPVVTRGVTRSVSRRGCSQLGEPLRRGV